MLLAVSASLGCRRGDAVKRDDVATTRAPKDALACPLPSDGRVMQALTLPPGCKATVTGVGIVVSAGASLEIEAGVELSFAPESQLVVRGGALRARGTEAAPIVLRAKSKRWMGLVFEKGEKGKGSRLERVEVRDVGSEAGAPAVPKAAIEIQPEAEETALANVRVRHCEPTSLRVASKATPPATGASGLASAEGLDFEAPESTGKPSITIGAKALGAIASAHVAAPIVLNDALITGPTAWPKLDAPIVAPTGLMLAGNGTGPRTELRLAEGATLLVGRGHRIYVGDVGPASLVAHRVRFDSAEPTPKAGDWPGIQLRDAFGSELVDCTIAHAGEALPAGKTGTPPGILDVRVRSVPKLERTKFVDGLGWAIVSYDGCASMTAPAAGNDFGRLSACYDQRAKLAAELDELEIKMLGALGAPGATNGVLSDSSSPSLDSVVGGPGATIGRAGSGGGDLRQGGGVRLPSPATPPSTTP